MDLILLLGIAISLLITIISIYFLQKNFSGNAKTEQPNQRGRPVPIRSQEGVPRRAQIARNQRNRARNLLADADPESPANDENEDEIIHNQSTEGAQVAIDEKMGAKKRAKLEAKAEKKVQREIELQAREDKKKKELLAEMERKKLDKEEAEAERKREESERLAREEQERKEEEEYMKMKEAFSIEEEGCEEEDESENLVQEFIDYIKINKVVVLEDLATHFKLKTQQVIDRIKDLEKDNKLTGVIDDRGKFIYISEDELKAVARFIKQRGRISISELAQSSNNLINLNPVST